MKLGLYIFTRDLRVQDNLGLLNFARHLGPGTHIFPVFILNPDQVTENARNINYFSRSALQFMCESLRDLDVQLKKKLSMFYGNPTDVLGHLLRALPDVCAVGFHRDFSPYALSREKDARTLCARLGKYVFVEENDYSLLPIDALCKKNGDGFKQFGAFSKHAQQKSSDIKTQPSRALAFYKPPMQKSAKFRWDAADLASLYDANEALAQRGGRKQGLAKLKRVTKKNFGNYAMHRDALSYNTTEISGYLNFGCLSVREVYLHFKKNLGTQSQLLKQLWWRDFYLQAAVYLPGGNEFGYMDERYKRIKWKNKKADWIKIINGETGFLVVDAAMRQMTQTGYMHNRARMIVGVFWTKYCLIDTFHPVYGSQVGFSKYLLDAVGISQNKLNHQWITEFDYPGKKYAPRGAPLAGRPMDVSNKIISKFDPDALYIKTWLPELAEIDVRDLARWDSNVCKKYGVHVPPMFGSNKYSEWVEACR
jgi:deoxyribodipyrimidine photo-lyase